MSSSESLEGGCACGAIRYRIVGTPNDAGFCHCRLCQRTTGAALIAWATVPIGAFEYVKGEPRVFVSSAWGERRFCPQCGAQLEYRRSDAPSTVEVNYATLDDPSAIAPKAHMWYASRIPGLEVAGGLPVRDDGDH